MRSDGSVFLLVALLGLCVGVIVVDVVYDATTAARQKEAVQEGAANYNTKTGEWQWAVKPTTVEGTCTNQQ